LFATKDTKSTKKAPGKAFVTFVAHNIVSFVAHRAAARGRRSSS
jgi:hypothetical protein